ncbi:rCG42970 [Rattus norvegicus]|uniref:RCG42970 n=1 Tax=Rattus norvegicus TaxID=10116 RepID=A6IVQ6_RAT|nr:rCG42970 [Rattus norvegicus]
MLCRCDWESLRGEKPCCIHTGLLGVHFLRALSRQYPLRYYGHRNETLTNSITQTDRAFRA